MVFIVVFPFHIEILNILLLTNHMCNDIYKVAYQYFLPKI